MARRVFGTSRLDAPRRTPELPRGSRSLAPPALGAVDEVGALGTGAAFGAFVRDIHGLHAARWNEEQLASRVALALQRLNDDGAWLPAWARLPVERGYAQHLLYVSPRKDFSVVSLVWKPGQTTCIHNHVAWCVVGVYEGTEIETRYALRRSAESAYLIETARVASRHGGVVALLPNGDDIHRVSNGGDELAISIHVYGADIRNLGTSIAQRFDDLPVRSA